MSEKVVDKEVRLKVIQAPPQYVQGPDALANIGKIAAAYGDRFIILTENFIYEMKKEMISKSFLSAGIFFTVVSFQGECCRREIERVKTIVEEQHLNGLIGFGGGKLLDTGKFVAEQCQIPYISVPSLASTDAPCTSVVVIYTDTGEVELSTKVRQNPQAVLVDTRVIADAPLRLFVSGMGDALSTYFEARTAMEQNCDNVLGGQITISAMALARACFDTLMADGRQAKVDLEEDRITSAVERIIEANTYLSGIGFESGGLSAAHGIHNALKDLPQTHSASHGELVAFGTLCLLELEKRHNDELERVMDFCKDVGLPVTVKQLGITEYAEEKIRQVARSATRQAAKYHMPANATEETIYQSIMNINRMGEL